MPLLVYTLKAALEADCFEQVIVSTDDAEIADIAEQQGASIFLRAAALADDYKTSREMNNLIYDLHKWLYIEGNPVGIKTAMEILGFGTNEVRLPLSPISSENYKYLERALRKILEVRV